MNWHFVLIKSLIQILQDIFEAGYYADKVLERAFKKNKKWGKRDRQFLAETTYEMVRFWLLLSKFDGQKFIPADYYKRWAYFEAWKNKADAFKFLKAKDHDLGISFEGALDKIKHADLTEIDYLSFPDWLVAKLNLKDLRALNEPAPVIMRANSLKTTSGDLLKALRGEGLDVDFLNKAELPDALALKVRKNVFATESFKNGLFEVQDAASQRVAPLLNPRPGERVADVCAGAGGKTLHLAALMQNKGELLAGDNHPKKLEQLKLRARRAGASNIRLQLFESSKDVKKHFGKFDAVLVDAPCSGTGVIRRNPDTKWKLTPQEVERLQGLQSEILELYSKLLKPKGRLVYATCSLLKEENQDQVEKFLKAHPEFKLKESFERSPSRHGEDGFYAARLERC